MSSLTSLVIPIVLVIIVAVYMSNRKKNKKNGENLGGVGRKKDEVVELIKQWLKDNGVVGQEVVVTDVFKRTQKEFKKRDVYVVLFRTKNFKLGTVTKERMIEAELIKKQIAKKKYDRYAQVNKECDYSKEMEWIKPLRDKKQKRDKSRSKYEAKQKLKAQKKDAKLRAKYRERSKKAKKM